jgi:putative transcriptional regulator
MTDEEVELAALSDPDAPPSTAEQLAQMRRVAYARHVRWKLGLSQTEFAVRFHIPIGTLRDWEQHRTKPDSAAAAYLRVIADNPDAVLQVLAEPQADAPRISAGE